MHAPKVTFLVPVLQARPSCCRNASTRFSAQTYQDFEVLILDDCSPDNTPEVARSFEDPRVRHIRNEPNLGHLRNYNKGIELAQGEYLWLISADDRLRKPYTLERYVEVMEANPTVGFAFCTGYLLVGQQETEIVQWANLESPDAIIEGRIFLRRLLQGNCVLAPAGMVRRECYDRLGRFPLDLPFAGDWYLWCLFALHYDVAYFAEPMVNYREHVQSMTSTLIADDIRRLSKDDFSVRWRMKEAVEALNDQSLARVCTSGIVEAYSRALSMKSWRGTRSRMSLAEFDESLRRTPSNPRSGHGSARRCWPPLAATCIGTAISRTI